MPSPIGHALAGVAVAWTADLIPGDRAWRTAPDRSTWYQRAGGDLTLACAVLGAALLLCAGPVSALFSRGPVLHNELTLLTLAVVGAIIYGIAIRVLFRREWRELMSGRLGSEPSA